MKPRRYAYTMLVMATGAALGVAGTVATQTALRPPGASALAKPSVEAALDRTIAEVNLVDVPLADAVARVGQAGGVSLELDEPSLHELAISPENLVTVRGRDLPLGDALDAVARATVGNGEQRTVELPIWTIEEGRRLVLTRVGSSRGQATFTRVYDVRDVLATMGLPPTSSSPDRPIRAPSGTTLCFAPSWAADDLVRVVEDNVLPGSWREVGLPGGTVRHTGGWLLVTQTYAGHRAVQRLLADLRREPPPAPVDGRFATRWHDGLGRWVPRDLQVTEAKMRSPLPEFRADAEPLRDAVDRWARSAGVDATIDPTAAQTGRADRPVSVGQRAASAGEALDAILAGGSADRGETLPRLSWWYDGGVVVVGMRADAELHGVTRVYDLHQWVDLVAQGDIVPPSVEPLSGLGLREQAIDYLTARLTTAIDRWSWTDNGGRVGTIQERGGFLIVRQLPENHPAIERFVDDHRRAATAKAAAISVSRPTGE